MRLHQLQLAAFGPFAGTETVDFDTLATAGIFLLNGPTGSGKTSILDAISFALYGKVPGARGDQLGDLRSHLADENLLTEVVLEATIRARRVRITRQPRQDRPKKRGGGTTTHPSSAIVKEWTGTDWESRASKPSDADEFLEELVGLTAEQFQQVILLPQGDFARFLRANANDRQALLQAVFDTKQFSAVARWLREEATRLGDELSELDTQLGAAFNECAGALETDTPDATDDARKRWLDDNDQRLLAALDAAQKAADAATKRVGEAVLDLEDQTRLHSLQDRHRKALEAHTALADQLNQLPLLEEQQRASIAAEPIRTILDQRSRAAIRHTEEKDRLDERLVVLRTVRPDLMDSDEAALRGAQTTLGEQLTRLGDLLADEKTRLPSLKKNAAESIEKLSALTAEIAAKSAKVDEMRSGLEEHRQLESDGTEAQKQLVAATAAVAKTKGALDAAADREGLRGESNELSERLSGAMQEAEAKETEYKALLRQRIASISAELAESLTAGNPCPVCGSPDHPQPAQATTALVTDNALNAALTAHNEAAQTATILVNDLANRRQRIEAITDAIGAAKLEEFERSYEAACALEQELQGRIRRGDDARQHLQTTNEDIAGREAEIAALKEQRPEIDSERRAAESGLNQLQEQLTEAASPFTSVQERVEVLTAQRDAIQHVLDSRQQVAQLDDTLKELLSDAELRATEAQFPSVEAAEAAMLGESELAKLTQQINDTKEQLTAIRTTLEDEDVINAVKRPPADPGAASIKVENLRVDERETTTVLSGINNQIESLRRCREAFDQAVEAGGPMRRQHETVRNLARLANGDTGAITQSVRMSLVNYVLSAQLARVASAASQRLSAMTNGRYTLLQTDEVSDGRAMGGLGIEVLDLHTTKTRGTRSLSGGESFIASLALALGLADVVAAEAGGVSLETLFIDEGFGTLDGDALNSVLDILDGLRSGGRAVGVVSHVTEMKERIPTHLVVQQVNRISHIVQATGSE